MAPDMAEFDPQASLPPFITRDEVVKAKLIQATIAEQDTFRENTQNKGKVNINVTVDGELRTVALPRWQVNQLAGDFKAKKPSELKGKKIFLYPFTLEDGQYAGTKVINASSRKPKA